MKKRKRLIAGVCLFFISGIAFISHTSSLVYADSEVTDQQFAKLVREAQTDAVWGIVDKSYNRDKSEGIVTVRMQKKDYTQMEIATGHNTNLPHTLSIIIVTPDRAVGEAADIDMQVAEYKCDEMSKEKIGSTDVRDDLWSVMNFNLWNMWESHVADPEQYYWMKGSRYEGEYPVDTYYLNATLEVGDMESKGTTSAGNTLVDIVSEQVIGYFSEEDLSAYETWSGSQIYMVGGKTYYTNANNAECNALIQRQSTAVKDLGYTCLDVTISFRNIKEEDFYKTELICPELSASENSVDTYTFKCPNNGMQRWQNQCLYLQSRSLMITQDFYTVKFELNGHGKPIDPLKEIADGQKISEPKKPIAKRYEFKGWYQDKKFKNIWDFNKDTVTTDMTLYARWEKVSLQNEKKRTPQQKTTKQTKEDIQTSSPNGTKKYCTISYLVSDEKGGYIEGRTTQKIGCGETAESVKAVAKEGYVFIGWNDGNPFAQRQEKNPKEDAQYTAKFAKVSFAVNLLGTELGILNNKNDTISLVPKISHRHVKNLNDVSGTTSTGAAIKVFRHCKLHWLFLLISMIFLIIWLKEYRKSKKGKIENAK